MTDPLRSIAAGSPAPPERCPLCGGANACAMACADPPAGPCWCAGVSFGAALLERVPPAARGRACICVACATAASAREASGAAK